MKTTEEPIKKWTLLIVNCLALFLESKDKLLNKKNKKYQREIALIKKKIELLSNLLTLD